jgi:hypothetical protein
MKKFLLGSTAIVAVASLLMTSGVTAAGDIEYKPVDRTSGHLTNPVDTPRLKISGEGTFHGMFHRQKQREQNAGKGNGVHFEMGDARINFDVFGKASQLKGLEYSLLLGLNGDTNETQNIQELRLKLKGDWGTVFLGNSTGVENFMSVGPWQNVFGGTGGADGNYTHAINRTSGAVVSVQPLGRTKTSTKFSYVTPRIMGFQAGVSFTPNTKHLGEQRLFTLNNTQDTGYVAGNSNYQGILGANGGGNALPFEKNNVAFGVNYKNKFSNGFDVAASALGIWGKTQAPQGRVATTGFANPNSANQSSFGRRDKTQTYLLGIVFGYAGFEAGFEFIDNGKSQEISSLQRNDAGKVYNFGAAYNLGPDKWSLGYAHTTRKLGGGILQGNLGLISVPDLGKATGNVYSIAWDRKLAPGLSVFVEGDYFKFDTNPLMNINPGYAGYQGWWIQGSAASNKESDFVDSNRGHVGMVGVKVKF